MIYDTCGDHRLVELNPETPIYHGRHTDIKLCLFDKSFYMGNEGALKFREKHKFWLEQ